MLSENDIELVKISVVGALSACAKLGELLQGQWTHMHIKEKKNQYGHNRSNCTDGHVREV